VRLAIAASTIAADTIAAVASVARCHRCGGLATIHAMRPLAILGGTFDPIHHGHLRVAWEAAEALDAELRMVPAAVPPHRPQPGASAAQRMAMLEAALAGQQRLRADDRELRRGGSSYTIDTLRELRAEIGPSRPLVLLVGADAFAGLSTWHDWRELFDHAHVGVLTRPGHGGAFEAELAAEWFTRRAIEAAALREGPAGRILAIEVTPLDISASAIRALLGCGRSPRFLLPDSVLALIEREHLYRR
jgi:nicotinate-nucleotide adenylyltransferase